MTQEAKHEHDTFGPKEMEPTSLEWARRVLDRLEAHGITSKEDQQVVLAILDRLGLFHSPSADKGYTNKLAQRKAHKARNEANRLKDLAPTFQINRGGRIIPSLSTGGRRPETEITVGVRFLDRSFQERNRKWSSQRRAECIADVLRATENSANDPHECRGLQCKHKNCQRKQKIEAVRFRLKEAKKLEKWMKEMEETYPEELKKPEHAEKRGRAEQLSDWNYKIIIRDARGIEFEENLQRQQEFDRLLRIANDESLSEQERAQAESELGRRFAIN